MITPGLSVGRENIYASCVNLNGNNLTKTVYNNCYITLTLTHVICPWFLI